MMKVKWKGEVSKTNKFKYVSSNPKTKNQPADKILNRRKIYYSCLEQEQESMR